MILTSAGKSSVQYTTRFGRCSYGKILTISRRNLETKAESILKECYLVRSEGTDKGIITLCMDRPKAKNAISRKFLNEFKENLKSIRNDTEARVLVLQSKVDGVFCAGADLKERVSMTQQEVWDFLYTLKQTFSELEELQIPTIAALDGAAFGGGLEMALSCDMRVAGKKGILGLTETSLAIIPGAGGTQRLTKLIGASKAKELIYTSARINPELSYQYGVISDYVGNNEKRQIADTKGVSNSGYELALEWARRIAMQGPVAVKMAKKAIDMGAHTDLKTGLGIEHQCYTTVLGTEDRNEGLLAFKEKRKPIYKGK